MTDVVNGEASIWTPEFNSVVRADTSRVEENQIASEGQLLFNLTTFSYATNTGSLAVYKNGLLLRVKLDWNEQSPSSFSLNASEAATAGDEITAVGWTQITGNLGGGGDMPFGTVVGQTMVWNGAAWIPNDTLNIGPWTGVEGQYGGSDLEGKALHTRRDPFSYDGLINGTFYVIGDSLTSPNGSSQIAVKYSTDAAGLITAASLQSFSGTFVRSFQFVIRSGIATLVGVPATLAWFDVTVSGGIVTAITFDRQSGAFPINLVDEVQAQNSANIASWAFQLYNKYALNGIISSIPAESYARPSTGYDYTSMPAPVTDEIALIMLGGNDVGGMDIGDGFGPDGTTPADLTQAQLQVACEAMYTSILADSYRVIIILAPYSDLDEILDQPRWNTATDLVNESIRAAAAVVGITEIWDMPTSNLLDGLHPTQVGHDYLMQSAYPRMVAATAGGTVTGQFVDLTSVQANIAGEKTFTDTNTNVQNLAATVNIAAGGLAVGNGNYAGIGAFGIVIDSGIPIGGGGPGVAVAGGHIISDGSGAQNISNCFGVAGITISGSQFVVTLTAAVTGAESMIIDTGQGAGIGDRTDTVDQTSTTTLVYSLILNSSLVVTNGLQFHFTVHDAGA